MFVIVCDIDGTLCDSRERCARVVAKYGNEEKWTNQCVDEFLDPKAIRKDKIMPGAENIVGVVKKCGKLVLLTGRTERSRKETARWLRRNLGISGVPLIMRDNNDFRGPAECKEDLFVRWILACNEGAKFVFFEDDSRLFGVFSKYGLVLKAPEIWEFLEALKSRKRT